jgi:hypothetical protein
MNIPCSHTSIDAISSVSATIPHLDTTSHDITNAPSSSIINMELGIDMASRKRARTVSSSLTTCNDENEIALPKKKVTGCNVEVPLSASSSSSSTLHIEEGNLSDVGTVNESYKVYKTFAPTQQVLPSMSTAPDVPTFVTLNKKSDENSTLTFILDCLEAGINTSEEHALLTLKYGYCS